MQAVFGGSLVGAIIHGQVCSEVKVGLMLDKLPHKRKRSRSAPAARIKTSPIFTLRLRMYRHTGGCQCNAPLLVGVQGQPGRSDRPTRGRAKACPLQRDSLKPARVRAARSALQLLQMEARRSGLPLTRPDRCTSRPAAQPDCMQHTSPACRHPKPGPPGWPAEHAKVQILRKKATL
jgi:hypothetical protein